MMPKMVVEVLAYERWFGEHRSNKICNTVQPFLIWTIWLERNNQTCCGIELFSNILKLISEIVVQLDDCYRQSPLSRLSLFGSL
jgi:hypothetical protein